MSNTSKTMPIAVLGAGSWGTALAMLLARNGNETRLWARSSEHVEQMRAESANEKYLPGISFPENLSVSSSLEATLKSVRDILIVVPSHAFRPLLKQIMPFIRSDSRLISACKGLDPESGDLLINVAADILGDTVPLAVLSGPNFAGELANNLPTATTLASLDKQFFADLVERMKNDRFRVYGSDDLIGVQLGGAIKNVIAVGAGMADGMGFGANARTALITRGLVELTRLGVAMGGKDSTFRGMAGMGDLVLTCTDNQSRNRRFGLAIGKGQDLKQAEAEIGQVVEAVRNAKEVHHLAKEKAVEVPICDAIYNILYKDVSPEVAAHNLLTRDLKFED
ncbi:MAG: NAD(P)H-dependent glycerol-3-phosphate dehydrogenase [Gammaproteobacteria bacterium]|nr:NAD(P)H-dependent glycerol-3-phosphate dehydrogenase [Gammaproteobacteria bacterium]